MTARTHRIPTRRTTAGTPRRAARTAALAAVVLALGACTASGDDVATSGGPSTPGGATSSAAAPATTEATDAAAARPGGSVEDADAAVTAVRDWLAAARESETDDLRARTGAYSLAAVEAIGGLEANASGLAEGMGAFGDAQDARWSAVVVPSVEGAWVVEVAGQVEREGMVERDARAFLVHPEEGGVVVEAFSDPAPEQVSPPARARAPDEPLEVILAGTDGEATVLLDGEPVADGVSVTADGDRLRVVVAPPQGWPQGEHVVTVAAVPATADAIGPWVASAHPVDVG